ncbi:endonuclease MutS2 [soil metagenome]
MTHSLSTAGDVSHDDSNDRDTDARLVLALAKIEYPAITAELAKRCHFSLAAQRALELEPHFDPWQCAEALAVTDEAVGLMIDLPSITVGSARDIGHAISRAEKGGRLLPLEIQDVADTAAAARSLRQQVVGSADAVTRFPHLVDFAVGLVTLPQFEEQVRRSVGAAGEILDTASESLGRIRREVRIAHQRLIERLNRIISGDTYATALQDRLVTTRDGRYVIPVRADARGQVPGVVHDSSASGQTLFVEPFDIVDMNNRWREAQLDEQHEIDRVLDMLSSQVAVHADAFRASVEALTELDLAFAKSRLAADWRATRPNIDATSAIVLNNARHPLLDPPTVVPVSLTVGRDFRILLITGPNTGGKTVALKTVGLLAMMTQSGLYVTADDDSILPVFEQLFVDIGDDQSIAQSLSTFSSHVSNVISMLGSVTATSLVLIDELGTGTDPVEGSALARAVIRELAEKGPVVVATTHFSEVKTYAYERREVENASVEFDVETLSPTYRLLMGVPGQSNALAIAKRLGMPEGVLEYARTLLDPDTVRVDELLADIQAKRAAAEQDARLAAESLERSRELFSERSALLEDARRERFAAYEEARKEADAALTESRKLLKRLQRAAVQPRAAVAPEDEISASDRNLLELEQARQTLREKSEALRVAPVIVKNFEAGDRVQVTSLAQEGTLVWRSADEAEVQLGTMRVRRPTDDVVRLGGPLRQVSAPIRMKAPGGFVSMEIDLRGRRYGDIEPELDQYLDAAIRSSLPFVRIVHGKGAGTLRKAVAEYLRSSPVIERFELGKMSEGGDGVTIAYLRD